MYNYDSLTNEAKAVISESEWTALIFRIIDILDKYADHGNNQDDDLEWNPSAISMNLLSWANNKADMIGKIKAHPNYNANEPYKIVHDVTAERVLNKNAVYKYAETLYNHRNSEESRNYYGDTFLYWIVCDCEETFLSDDNIKNYNQRRDSWKGAYDGDDYMQNHYLLAPNTPYSEELYQKILRVNPHEGQKTNKFVRKLVTTIMGSVDEREFAKYSDALNPTVFKRKATFSVDPVDYLMMSHGNSWASCYWINQYDPGCYEGCYSNGTWSYMNDKCTAIMSIVDNDTVENFAEAPKIYRQVVMFNGEDTIISSRVYPSDENGSNIRKEFRGYAQQFISELYNLGNNWNVKECEWENDADKPLFDQYSFTMRDILTNDNFFVGYTDPYYFRQSVSVNKAAFTASEKTAPKKIVYGAKAYCPVCGSSWRGGQSSRYVCEDCDESRNHRHQIQCERCGDWYDEDSDYIHWCEDVNEYRCDSCCHYCDYHSVYEAETEMYTVYRRGWGGRAITEDWCEEAVEDDAIRCAECDDYWRESDCYYIKSEQAWFCPDCYDRYFTSCDECCGDFREENLNEYVDPETGEVMMLCDECYERKLEKERERRREMEHEADIAVEAEEEVC